VSFGKEEIFTIFLSLKKLAEDKPLKSVRLWGKIFGTVANYIVVEGELREGAIDEDEAAANFVPGSDPVEEEPPAPAAVEGEEPVKVKDPEADEPGQPKPKVKVVPPLPKESGVGANKYAYYVCNFGRSPRSRGDGLKRELGCPGGPWSRLPDVIPEKLQASRKIRKYMTGNLSEHIISYPPFDGNEAQYLRCQIARISAATVVSPIGYYTFDQEEGDGDDSDRNGSIIINPDYESRSNEQLLSPSNWAHHVPYIMPQGRTTWENPFSALRGEGGQDGGEEDEESEGGSEGGDNEEGEGEGAPVPETGPPILSALNGDDDMGDVPSWVSRLCSSLSPTKYSPVLLRSTRWPGATVVAYNDRFNNVYVGDGLKELSDARQRFVPPPLPEVQKEYAEPMMEQADPTLEEEKAYEDEKRAKEEEKEEDESEAGGEEEGSDAED
ncbi:radial spokehead-like protein, partial [Blyttiomyces helicus]